VVFGVFQVVGFECYEGEARCYCAGLVDFVFVFWYVSYGHVIKNIWLLCEVVFVLYVRMVGLGLFEILSFKVVHLPKALMAGPAASFAVMHSSLIGAPSQDAELGAIARMISSAVLARVKDVAPRRRNDKRVDLSCIFCLSFLKWRVFV
jgi:hypothetical protein